MGNSLGINNGDDLHLQILQLPGHNYDNVDCSIGCSIGIVILLEIRLVLFTIHAHTNCTIYYSMMIKLLEHAFTKVMFRVVWMASIMHDEQIKDSRGMTEISEILQTSNILCIFKKHTK